MGVSLRKVKEQDLEKILDWRNEPDVRKKSTNTKKITWNEHAAYWRKRLANPDQYSFVIVSDGEDAGLLRLDKKESSSSEVSILVDAEHQGKGVGSAALEKAKEFAKSEGIYKLVARVKEGNIASHKLFEKSGFKKSGEAYECSL